LDTHAYNSDFSSINFVVRIFKLITVDLWKFYWMFMFAFSVHDVLISRVKKVV